MTKILYKDIMCIISNIERLIMSKVSVDIEELMRQKQECLMILRQLPNKDRCYREYTRINNKIRYHTNEKERLQKCEASRERLKHLYGTEEYNSYKVSLYHKHQARKRNEILSGLSIAV